MKRFDSLRTRVVKAYLLFSLGCTIIFAVATAIVVEGLEIKLVDQRLREVANWAAPRLAGGMPVEMPAGISFLHGDAIPSSLRNVGEGIHELEVDGVNLHVYASRTGDRPFVVVDHDSDYEAVELAVYSLVAAVFLGFAAMSWFLGRFLARRIVTPITDLSAAVSARRAQLPLLESQDELGTLARAFAGHTAELQAFLDRERFFTGDVSHELRTPLTVIAGAAEILQAGTRDQPALQAAAERIERAAHDASHSVSMLLLLARAPEAIPTEPLAVAQVISAEVARYQALVAHKPVQLVDGRGPDFIVQAPRALLAAALSNLIRNACLYTEQGSVTVSCAGRSIYVRDTGPGLPAATLAMLAGDAPAVRLPGSAGTGLGLMLVRRICQYLGARISAASDGSGTTITLHFPDDLTPS